MRSMCRVLIKKKRLQWDVQPYHTVPYHAKSVVIFKTNLKPWCVETEHMYFIVHQIAMKLTRIQSFICSFFLNAIGNVTVNFSLYRF